MAYHSLTLMVKMLSVDYYIPTDYGPTTDRWLHARDTAASLCGSTYACTSALLGINRNGLIYYLRIHKQTVTWNWHGMLFTCRDEAVLNRELGTMIITFSPCFFLFLSFLVYLY